MSEHNLKIASDALLAAGHSKESFVTLQADLTQPVAYPGGPVTQFSRVLTHILRAILHSHCRASLRPHCGTAALALQHHRLFNTPHAAAGRMIWFS